MYKIVVSLLLIFTLPAQEAPAPFAISGAIKNEKASILVVVVGKSNAINEQFIPALKKALEFKDQMKLTITYRDAILNKQEAIAQKKDGFHYIIFLDYTAPDSIEWHLFDTQQEKMIKAKKIQKRGTVVRGWAYTVADSIHEALTGDPGFFSTKIAYVKQIVRKKGTSYQYVYMCDFDGSNAEVLVQTPTINSSPRWNKDSKRPLLFYSENTTTNTQLAVVDMKKRRIVASNFDGLNMQPAFSPDGKTVIYCATRGSGKCHLYQWSSKNLKKLTQNVGNNFAPVYGADGHTIYFCSDFEASNPQLYHYCLKSEKLTRLTPSGYCVSPTYCLHTNKLGYSKMVHGVMQLFEYDPVTQAHQQLTFDDAQKQECIWSPCGTFLLCPYEKNDSQQIALFNTITKKYTFLTDSHENCGYPSWSGNYDEYPVVRS